MVYIAQNPAHVRSIGCDFSTAAARIVPARGTNCPVTASTEIAQAVGRITRVAPSDPREELGREMLGRLTDRRRVHTHARRGNKRGSASEIVEGSWDELLQHLRTNGAQQIEKLAPAGLSSEPLI